MNDLKNTGKALSCLQYNTHLFLGTVPGFFDPDLEYEDETRLEGIIARLRKSGADVVTLCEVWSDSVKERIAEALVNELAFSRFEATSKLVIGSGLLVLSRWPLGDQTFTEFQCLSGADALSQKGFMSLRVAAGERPFFLMATHTQADQDAKAIRCRNGNISQLVSKILELQAKEDIPLLLAGDLNVIGDHGDEYESMRMSFEKVGLEDAFRTRHPSVSAEPGYTYDGEENKLVRIFEPEDADTRQRLDYVWVTSCGRGSEIDTAEVVRSFVFEDLKIGGLNDLSDHFPLSVALKF
jgi:endonuclease/exonuclease/phosphatase family metal-dependent hydrolase